ncbi:ion channel domain-containing protein [Ditylenchus destructor]|uniref:Ion channel domain-containing protein n=1 Tax=Ditylenchus destructor TaxID=166010 RepID=A0AAD4N7X4_9BILA|nr:ion channel domain-containing protein [Ditylenchus destructor]
MPFRWPFRDPLPEDKQRLWKQIASRLFSPHILLILSTAAYIVFGAWIFQMLEGKHLLETKAKQLRNIDKDSIEYSEDVWDIIQANPERYLNELDHDAAVREIRALSQQKFDKYVDTVFTAHRSVRHGFEENAPTWDTMNSLFFTATMLTSIGFGYVCPTTFEGRLFGVIYCLIGIPLTLVTVANISKFASETIFSMHYHIWKFWIRLKTRSRESSEEENGQIFNDSEDEQDVLDRVRLIRFPPIVVFIFAIIYGFFGAYCIQFNEKWTYSESLYYTFISILTVGFGDYRPSPNNMIIVLVIITGGIILTTMCMDVVGRMYLKEIHYLGRKLRSNNPFYMLREAKAKRRRAAMASLLAQLARGMIFAHRNFNELSRKRSKKEKRHGSKILPDGKFMFARMAPDPPRECQVVSTSAYSVRLAWAPAFSADVNVKVTYNIRYRLKYYTNDGEYHRNALELKAIQGNSVEIMSIQSCSLYEFRITAVSKYGESKPVVLVQYTEPQLSPQHIMAKKLNANTVELTWEPPYKRTNEVRNYMVYWSDNPSARLADWEKVTVYGRRVVFPELKYDWFYLFCANACFKDGQRSPLSRALFVKTDKLEFNTNCVGHSRTIEVMEAISDKVEASETSPLLKRDYASFTAAYTTPTGF